MSPANRFKNIYRGQLFNFCLPLRFFFPQNFTPRDAHCFWQCTDSRTFTEGNFSTSGPLFLFFLKISLLEMLIAFGNAQIQEPLLRATFQLLSPHFFSLKISLLEMLIAFGNEHLKTGGSWASAGWFCRGVILYLFLEDFLEGNKTSYFIKI